MYCRIFLSTSYSDVRHCSRWRFDVLVRFWDPYFEELFSDDAHPLEIKGGVLSLLHMSIDDMSIDVLYLVCLPVKVVARDVVPTYLGHRKARASKVVDFVQERRIR